MISSQIVGFNPRKHTYQIWPEDEDVFMIIWVLRCIGSISMYVAVCTIKWCRLCALGFTARPHSFHLELVLRGLDKTGKPRCED